MNLAFIANKIILSYFTAYTNIEVEVLPHVRLSHDKFL